MNRRFIKSTLAYAGYRLKILALFAAFSVIFAVITVLNGLPLSSVAYAFLLCAFVGLVAVIIDFISFYSKHIQLSNMLGTIDISEDGLPPGGGLIEADYRELIHVLFAKNRKTATDYETAIADMTDYYTLWVHQIKTPISAMYLLLQSGEGGSKQNLKLELFKVEQYVDMVLSFLKINGASSDLVLMRQGLSKIIRQAVRKCSLIFIHKKIRLNFTDFEYEVLTDEKWLAFVIEQILTNSLKYTESGSISIYLDNEKRLVIEDTGIGIAREDIPRIFEKGYTGYNGRIYKKSTGIGLYMCKKIMSRLSHTINVESEAGAGTRVILGFDTAEISAE